MANRDIMNRFISLLMVISCFSMAANAQFYIGTGEWVTIQEGGSLMIGTDLEIRSDATSSGYLVDQTINGDVTVTGDVEIERYMTPDIWHNVASPVSNANSSVYTGTNLIFYYDETIILNDWEFGWVLHSGPLEVFRGYDVLFYDSPLTVVYTATGAETVNTGDYTGTVDITHPPNGEIPSRKGWNLMANPYPSPVDWLAPGWDKADINDAKYIWDGSNSVYTIFIGGGAPIGINGGTQFIPSNQGFWVQAIVSGTMSISNPTRVGVITGTPDFYKTDSIDYQMLDLVSSGNGYSDEIVIRFIEGTSSGFDINYDASKLFSPVPEVPQITIKNGNQYLAINTLPEIHEDLAIHLDFRCGKEGYYKLEATERTFLEDSVIVYLKDELEQKLIEFKSAGVYEFFHNTSNNRHRFTIYFNPSRDVINNLTKETYYSIYAHSNVISVLKHTVKDVSGEVHVHNMLGQPVCIEPLHNSERSDYHLNVPTGYYIVTVVTPLHIYNEKVFINK